MTDLHWLPPIPDWRQRLKAFAASPSPRWEDAIALANARLNFVLTNALDAAVQRAWSEPPPGLVTKPLRLAVIGSATLTHLPPAIRAAGVRRGLWIDTYVCDFGQYWQELTDPDSPLHAFRPDAIECGCV